MTPYLGILVDSFWEAVGNKVLWALLIGWSVLLICLAPFGYVAERSFQLSSADIDNRTQLIEKLAKGSQGQGAQAVQAVASKIDPKFLERVRKAADEDSGNRIKSSDLAKELNAAVAAPGLYSPEAFPTAERRKRLKPLTSAQANELSESDLEELNRELLQLAFPLELNRPRGEQLWVGYASFKIGEPLPISRRQIREFLEPVILQVIIKFGLAVLAVFVAIIVTSPIIPDTFRSGSLHLLLSKPISRVWLYLSKFFGGTIFVFVNITFVLIGLYFIAGLRFEIWNSGLLKCIPILLFVFVIFYSVSGLAGLLWGNAIVCVVSCMIFWFACFVIGFAKGAMQPHVEIYPQIRSVQEIAGQITVVTERGDFGVWNEPFSVWQPGIRNENPGGPQRTFGPIYDAQRNQLLVKSFFRNPFGSPFARNRKLDFVSLAPEAALDELDELPKSANEARKIPHWAADPGPEIPAQLFDLVRLHETVIAVCRGGLYRLNLEQLELIEASEQALFGLFKLPAWASQSAFENIAPKDYYLTENSTAASTANGQGLILFSSGNLDHLELTPDGFQIAASTKLDGDADDTEAALVEMNEEFCVVARDGLPLDVLNSQLEPVTQVPLGDDWAVKQMAWIPGSNGLAIVTHSGKLLELDCETGEVDSIDLPISGDVTCMTWSNASQLWIGVKPNEAYQIDLQTNEVLASYIPAPTIFESIYNWGVNPLFNILPKPAALDDAMMYVLTGNETQSLNVLTNDLQAAQRELDVWTPILSNSAFVFVVLAISCYYVARKEF